MCVWCVKYIQLLDFVSLQNRWCGTNTTTMRVWRGWMKATSPASFRIVVGGYSECSFERLLFDKWLSHISLTSPQQKCFT